MTRPFDGHVHVGAWRLPDFAGHASDPSDLLNIYRRWAYAGALVFSTDVADNRAILETIPRRSGELEFRHAFWVAPDLPGNLSTLEETVESWAALKIHPSILRRPIDDPAFEPYLAVAASHGIPALVHCGRWQEMAGYGLVLDVAQRRPEIHFILGHLGGDSPHLVAACTARIAGQEIGNVSLGTESIREPWVLERTLEKLGPSRLVFGSDYNLNHPEPFRRLIEVLDISDSAREGIFIGNLNRLFPPAHRILEDGQ